MKIERLEASGFLGLRRFAADFGPVTLVTGPNASGKSSVLEAIRFALLGDSPRVGLKKDFPALLSAGVKDGEVAVVVDGRRVARSVRTGNCNGPSYEAPAALGYVLGAERVSALAPAELRRLLLRLYGVAVSPAEIARELVNRGHDPGRVGLLSAALRGGFDAGAREAREFAAAARGAWRQITGEAYGAKKAEGWVAPAPAEVPERRPDVREAEAVYEAAVKEHGAVLARREARERALEAAGRLRALAATVGRCREEVERLEAAAGVMRGVPVGPCPGCGLELAASGGVVVPASECVGNEWAPPVPRGVEAARERLREAEEAVASLPEVERLLAANPGIDEDAVGAVERARAAVEAARAADRAYEAAVAAVAAARRRTEEAGARHREVVAWSALEVDLSPDGLPAELMGRALGPLNERLLASHAVTGWPVVQVSADMAIRADGRLYGLLSESERWRVDAVLAEAVAHAAGLGVLVLDGFDVLDLRGRSRLVRWLSGLAPEYGTIIAAGTLKAAPSGLPPGLSAVWLGPPEGAAGRVAA